MLIDLIHDNAEKALLSFLEQANKKNITWGALHFRCGVLATAPNEQDLLLTVRSLLVDKSSALYFLGNGDVVITWSGSQKATLEDLCQRLYERYAAHAGEKLHSYYDLHAHGEELRMVAKQLLQEEEKKKPKPAAAVTPAAPLLVLSISEKHAVLFQAALRERASRVVPEMLVVEDQEFSRKLLAGMLSQTYTVHGAADAAQAIDLYCKHASDLVFLDVELPDRDGHEVAAALRKLDPQVYIVMVTANHDAQTVLRAKENGVKGFVVKPYSKIKIQSSVDKFLQERKK